ncbi:flagellar hook assembly protein FlgD [Phenylobacterium sp.]|jgi:flagellar basal-body rod modification protein FlgD|uniref:flagellar hook assembly protein FlgD n=1 Tax=Phenylobacterium sp. TaxID=1871053 RepID=UPI002F400BC9
MAIDATAAAAAATSTDATAAGKTRLADNFDTFLTLLTTQLKNQDPLAPMDANQFTQQIVQMTGVEQQLLSNDLLQKLVSNTGSGVQTAVGLIGKDVSAATTDTALKNGKADWIYNLDSDAANVNIEVLDSKGRIVHAEAVTNAKAGDAAYSWNGKDASGQKLPDGTYTLRIAATDASGQAIGGSVFVEGLVTAVEQVDGKTMLTINGGKVPWETINTISMAPAAADNTSDGQTRAAAAA